MVAYIRLIRRYCSRRRPAMTLEAAASPVRLRDLSGLPPGTEIEARDLNSIRYRGRVVDTAPGLGIVWIREAGHGARRILDQHEFSLWLVQPDC
jgi:hypothetical protein